MYEKSENNQTWFTIDCPKDQQTPFCILFPVCAVFSGKRGVGVGVRAEGGSGGIGGQEEKTSPAHQGWGFP